MNTALRSADESLRYAQDRLGRQRLYRGKDTTAIVELVIADCAVALAAHSTQIQPGDSKDAAPPPNVSAMKEVQRLCSLVKSFVEKHGAKIERAIQMQPAEPNPTYSYPVSVMRKAIELLSLSLVALQPYTTHTDIVNILSHLGRICAGSNIDVAKVRDERSGKDGTGREKGGS